MLGGETMGKTDLINMKPKFTIRYKCMSCRNKFWFAKGYKMKSDFTGSTYYYCIECAEEIKKKSRV